MPAAQPCPCLRLSPAGGCACSTLHELTFVRIKSDGIICGNERQYRKRPVRLVELVSVDINEGGVLRSRTVGIALESGDQRPEIVLRPPMEGRVGFEPSTPGLKVRACAAELSDPTADSNSAVLTAWTD